MIVRTAADLPNLKGLDLIFDFETASGHKKLMSVNPWRHCRIGGLGVATRESAAEGKGWYLPVGHTTGNSRDGIENREPNQLDPAIASKWFYDLISQCDRMYAQNQKYDAHVLVNNWQEYQDFKTLILQKDWLDTLTWAKLVDSDRWSYSLANLGKDWLGDEKGSAELQPYLKTAGGKSFNQDFGQIPSEICGKYCIQDVLLTAQLIDYCRENMMTECAGVWETEQKITKILWKIEHTGLRLDVQRLQFMSMFTEQFLSKLEEDISKILISDDCRYKSIRPGENSDCFDVLCAHYGLPVLEWTAGGKGGKNKKPSFNKAALKAYLHHPKVIENENLTKLVKLILKFRKWDIINSMFLTPYQELHRSGLLHGDFNQIIRTGRMSMARPNGQQMPAEVRSLIVPYDQDYAFQEKYLQDEKGEYKGLTAAGVESEECIVARDASQIEFRIIVHYTKNKKALAAYNNDPATDYHQTIAEMNNIPRSAAKNINFMLSFGGGKYKTLSMLKDSLDSLGNYDDLQKSRYEGRIKHVPEVVWKGRVLQKEMRLEGYEAFCYDQSISTYDRYHKLFPELKKVSWKAQSVLQERGWVKNLYGRIRKLPVWAANKTFNSLIQSSAADLFKERIVALDEQFPEVKICMLVHDEVVTSETRDQLQDTKLQDGIMESLCTPSIKLDLPILWSKSVGTKNWKECK